MNPNQNLESQSKRHELFVMSLFRIIKLVTMHKLDNQAVQRGVENAALHMKDIFVFEDQSLEALFVQDDIFINGQALKASRDTYEALRELGDLLRSISFNQIQVSRDVSQADLQKLLHTFHELRRSTSHHTQSTLKISDQITLQSVDLSALLLDSDKDDQSITLKIAQSLATTRILLAYTLESGKRGHFPYSTLLKRAIQQLVMLSQSNPGELIQALEARPTRNDPIALSVQTTIVATLTYQNLTQDPRNIMDLAMCCIHMGLPQQHLVFEIKQDDPFGEDGPDVILSPAQLDGLSTRAALLTTHNTGFYERSLRRTALNAEVFALLNRHRTGMPYNGKVAPSLEAIIIATSWTFQKLLSVDELERDQTFSIDDVLALLIKSAESPAEKLVLKLICTTLGIYPRGTCVELDSGVVGIVSQNHDQPHLYNRPQLYTQTSPDHAPTFVDLAKFTPDTLAMGYIEGITTPPNQTYQHMRRAILDKTVTPPALIDPTQAAIDAIQQISELDREGEPEPYNAQAPVSLTDSDRYNKRLQHIQQITQDSLNESNELEPNANFFSTQHDT